MVPDEKTSSNAPRHNRGRGSPRPSAYWRLKRRGACCESGGASCCRSYLDRSSPMSKPNIKSHLGHFERDGIICRQGDDDLLRAHPLSAPVPSDCPPHPPDDLANAGLTESALPLERSDWSPADDSNRSPSISKGLPSGDDPYLECADSLLPMGESFPISFLQRRFRIGYSRAVRLHEAVIKRRADWESNHRSGNG